MTDKAKPAHLRGLPGSNQASKQQGSAETQPEQLRFELQIPQLIDIPTLAARLGTSQRHIRRLINEKRIPYLKVGHLVRFDVMEIAEWLKERRFGLGDARAVASGQ